MRIIFMKKGQNIYLFIDEKHQKYLRKYFFKISFLSVQIVLT